MPAAKCTRRLISRQHPYSWGSLPAEHPSLDSGTRHPTDLGRDRWPAGPPPPTHSATRKLSLLSPATVPLSPPSLHGHPEGDQPQLPLADDASDDPRRTMRMKNTPILPPLPTRCPGPAPCPLSTRGTSQPLGSVFCPCVWLEKTQRGTESQVTGTTDLPVRV